MFKEGKMKGVREYERFLDEISPSTSNSNSFYHNAAGLPYPSVGASNLFSSSNGYGNPDVGSSEVGPLDHSRYHIPKSHLLNQTYGGYNLPESYLSRMDEDALVRGFEKMSMADVSSGIGIGQSYENPESHYNVGEFGTSMADNFRGFGFSSSVCRDTRNGTVKDESNYGLGQTMANQGRNPYLVLDHHSDSFRYNPPTYLMQNHQNSLYNLPVQRTIHQGEDYNRNDRISVHDEVDFMRYSLGNSLDPRTMYSYPVFCNSKADSQNIIMYRNPYNEDVGLNSQQTISMRNAVCNQKRAKLRAFSHKRLNGTLRNGNLLSNRNAPQMRSLRSNVLVWARDQEGSQLLQDVYEKGSLEDRQTIFDEVLDHITELMMDTFANYLIQKMLCFSTEEQRIMIVEVATEEPGRLLRIAMNSHGTRVVQTMVECIKTSFEISRVVLALKPGFLDLMKDSNGNHVGQRCFEKLSSEDNRVFSLIALTHCIEIATHRFGCVVFQRCLSYSDGEVQQRLIKMICDNALMLARDPFGNYAVQYIMVEKLLIVPEDLLNHFDGKYVNLSTQKFSSHVVEKCLLFIPESRPRIVREWLSVPRFEQILQDPYANFVIQRALESIQGHLYKALAAAIRPHQARLRHNPYCRNIFNKGLLNK